MSGGRRQEFERWSPGNVYEGYGPHDQDDGSRYDRRSTDRGGRAILYYQSLSDLDVDKLNVRTVMVNDRHTCIHLQNWMTRR